MPSPAYINHQLNALHACKSGCWKQDGYRWSTDIRNSLHLVDLDTILRSQEEVEHTIFRCSLKQRRSIAEAIIEPKAHGAKLPKLEVPTFDVPLMAMSWIGSIFVRVAVHDRTDVAPAVYLENALKDRLTKSGEHYEQCLQARFDRPRLIHQTHVRRIVDTPNLKDGNGKELRCPACPAPTSIERNGALNNLLPHSWNLIRNRLLHGTNIWHKTIRSVLSAGEDQPNHVPRWWDNSPKNA